jgi:hypothetical protein
MKSDASAQSAEHGESSDSSRKFNMILANDFDFRSNALYLLDGKVINDISAVDPNSIRSIKVVQHPAKDNVYVVLYGAKASNGVVVIESKKPFLQPVANR